MIRSFPEITQRRIDRLASYMRAEVLQKESCVCPYFSDCRKSRSEYPYYEAQLSHVGKHYDLEINGRPTRIVLVGQEYGHGPAKVDLPKRSQMIAESASRPFQKRNPHMKGVASTLRLLLGRKTGTDAEGEHLLGAHIYDGFSLVNYLLCSAVREARDVGMENFKGAAKGFSHSVMRRNCSRHFLSTLEILEPTVIVVHGQGIRRWLRDYLSWPMGTSEITRVQIGGRGVDVLIFNHPSAGGASGYWGNSPRSRYLVERVVPTIEMFARRFGEIR